MRPRQLELEGALRAAAALASWRFGAVGVKARGGGLHLVSPCQDWSFAGPVASATRSSGRRI
jgi:hypothetical protein